MGRILADFKAAQIGSLFVSQGQILDVDELSAQFQPEFRFVPLAPFQRFQDLGDHVQRFGWMAVLDIPADDPRTPGKNAVTAVGIIGHFVVGVLRSVR